MTIYLNDTHFKHNLLHTYSDDVVSYYDSSCVFLIDALSSIIYVSNLNTFNNTAIYNQNSFIAKMEKVYMIDSNLSHGNFFYLGNSFRNQSM